MNNVEIGQLIILQLSVLNNVQALANYAQLNVYQIALNAIIGCFAVLAGVIIMFSEEPLTIYEIAFCFTDRGSIVFIFGYLLIETYKRWRYMADQYTVL